ncbi:MAG: DUF1257 domain-containing protein [Candidatus Omnitrophica bacterium]|nr:DUF1257 domain-containing protein [Candidatus Omnitrophota bacterium]
MSSGGGIDLCIVSIVALIKAIKDLNLARKELAYQQNCKMTTTEGKAYNVDVMVKDDNNRQIGFQKQKDGTCKVIADSAGLTPAQLKKQKSFINKIRQRYAYNKILGELKKEGYQLVEEKKEAKDTVRLLARRWVK